MKKIGLQIFGENELMFRIQQGDPVYSHCISIRNSSLHGDGKMPFPLPSEIKNGFKDILHLEFHDVEKRDWFPPGWEEARIPEIDDVVKVIKFVKHAAKDPDLTGFTIHCWRGVSRSAAIAIGIAYMLCKDEETAAKYIQHIRPEAAPLPLIVKFWDSILSSSLTEEVAIMRAKRFKKMKEDFLKDIAEGDLLLEELPVIENL